MELIRFPKAAENVTEGTVSRWLVAPGARVAKDEPLVELITEKAEFSLPSPMAGRLAAIYAPERATVPVGYVLCILAEENETLPDVDTLNAEAIERHQAEMLGLPAPEAAAPPPPPPTATTAPAAGTRVAASPAAKRLAKEKGIELAAVAAALGLTRQLSEDDVRKYLADKGL